MLVIVYCVDRPDSSALRVATRPAHLKYMIAVRDRLAFGGPLLADDGRPTGSVFALHVDELADVEVFLAGEPYCRAGLFSEVRIRPMVQMVPEEPPGRLDAELARAQASSMS